MNQHVIFKCLSEILEKDPSEISEFDPNQSLLDIGMTSLRFISFIVKLEEELNIEVLDSDLIFENFETIEKLLKTLSKYFHHEEQIKKVLVLDADNVLWKGVSGEEPTVIDDHILLFQQTLLELCERGVLLCLCSKNQPENVDKAFTMPRMLLKKEHFAAFFANRKDKASNIRNIAEELNLSTDSFVFVDDSDYELGFVGINFSDIECLKIDHNSPNNVCERLSSLFAHVTPTSSLNRTQLYREQKEREKEKHRFTTVQEYNASLETHITCGRARPDECARLSELSVRTHQFNLSNRQYTREDIEAMLADPGYTVLSLSVRDKYGDMGIVGMAVAHETTIESFMLSCRVFDRDLEYVLLNEIKKHVNSQLYGIYVPTDKNRQIASFYQENGVQLT